MLIWLKRSAIRELFHDRRAESCWSLIVSLRSWYLGQTANIWCSSSMIGSKNGKLESVSAAGVEHVLQHLFHVFMS